MKRILPLLLIVALLAGCNASAPCVQQTVFCMDTVMDIQIWGEERQQAMDSIVQMLKDLEKTWSVTDENSHLAALNRGEGMPNAQQQAFLDKAISLRERTDGAFDPKLQSLVAQWGFYDDAFRVPTAQQLQAARAEEKWDLGAVVKGYAGLMAAQLLAQYDVERAILNLGGNVQTYGTKPNGEAWKVGIQNPDGGDNLGVLSFAGTLAVVTSGDYQRYFMQDGVRYHHILDPQTGYPAASGLRSVTVLCSDGMVADALSTALFVMGMEKGAEFWQQSEDFEAVFVLEDGRIYATEGVALSGCEYEVIHREN